MKPYNKVHAHTINRFFNNQSLLEPIPPTKQKLIKDLARRLELQDVRRVELIFRVTTRHLCRNLSKQEVRLLEGRLPAGMKFYTWIGRRDGCLQSSTGCTGMHHFLLNLRDACGFHSMEETLATAKEVFAVLGSVVDLKDLSKSLPSELREVLLIVDEQMRTVSTQGRQHVSLIHAD